MDEAAVEAPKPAADDSAPVAPELVASAVAFKAYMQKSAALTPKFTGGAMVKASLERAEAYKIQQLAAGEVAYAALVALSGRRLRGGGIQAQGLSAKPRSDLNELVASRRKTCCRSTAPATRPPPPARRWRGSGRALVTDGRAVKKAAYTVQAEAWSKKAAEGQEARLADAKKISQLEAAVSKDDTKLLMTSLVDYRTRGQSAEAGARYRPPWPRDWRWPP